MAASELADMVRAAWQRRWRQCPALGHQLRGCFPERWVRFHSLPGSKRYATGAGEYAIILDRHNTMLTELSPASR